MSLGDVNITFEFQNTIDEGFVGFWTDVDFVELVKLYDQSFSCGGGSESDPKSSSLDNSSNSFKTNASPDGTTMVFKTIG